MSVSTSFQWRILTGTNKDTQCGIHVLTNMEPRLQKTRILGEALIFLMGLFGIFSNMRVIWFRISVVWFWNNSEKNGSKKGKGGGLPFWENSQIIQYKRQWFPIICHLASVIVFIVKLKLMLKKQTSPGCPEHWSGPHTGRTGNAPRKQTKSNFLFLVSEHKRF